jgi:hypothetical protein
MYRAKGCQSVNIVRAYHDVERAGQDYDLVKDDDTKDYFLTSIPVIGGLK